MSKTRYGWEVPVHSVSEVEGGSNIRLDFGNSCFGSLFIPQKGLTIPKRVKLMMEIEDASPAPAVAE